MDAVLFACVHNAGRSQMAAGWFNKICNRTKASGISAGTEPGERVHPEVVRVMKEEGIDLASMSPQFLSTELAQKATLLVTMGCGQTGRNPKERVADDSDRTTVMAGIRASW
jgi:arsenate reductase